MKIRFVFEDGSERVYDNHVLTGSGKGLIVRVETFPKNGSPKAWLATFVLAMKVVGKVLEV